VLVEWLGLLGERATTASPPEAFELHELDVASRPASAGEQSGSPMHVTMRSTTSTSTDASRSRIRLGSIGGASRTATRSRLVARLDARRSLRRWSRGRSGRAWSQSQPEGKSSPSRRASSWPARLTETNRSPRGCVWRLSDRERVPAGGIAAGGWAGGSAKRGRSECRRSSPKPIPSKGRRPSE